MSPERIQPEARPSPAGGDPCPGQNESAPGASASAGPVPPGAGSGPDPALVSSFEKAPLPSFIPPGWSEWDTGGGCTALRTNVDAQENFYLLVTSIDGPQSPREASERSIVAVYDGLRKASLGARAGSAEWCLRTGGALAEHLAQRLEDLGDASEEMLSDEAWRYVDRCGWKPEIEVLTRERVGQDAALARDLEATGEKGFQIARRLIDAIVGHHATSHDPQTQALYDLAMRNLDEVSRVQQRFRAASRGPAAPEQL